MKKILTIHNLKVAALLITAYIFGILASEKIYAALNAFFSIAFLFLAGFVFIVEALSKSEYDRREHEMEVAYSAKKAAKNAQMDVKSALTLIQQQGNRYDKAFIEQSKAIEDLQEIVKGQDNGN